ncbi:hypothetical protein B0537_05800 [Desulforamulus ferrireducens]|uniref:DUF5362 domain-containing protein n=1 Tax=Desulforamulus ferrireducens TaxID=1833852 RepID=A0A1S6IV43_9FIRM|nr:hypothetical protein B0537_05800 [Desulforamulus ferrireducens]
MVNREYWQQLSKWAGLVGILNIIFGAFSAICGVFAFIIGAIPGIIMIVLGVKLRNAKKYADEMLAEEESEGKINLILMNLNSYFMIQGILLIIALVFCALGMLGCFWAGFALFSQIPF